MAGYSYNRSRYYTRSQHLSDQRDDINTILKLKSEVRELKAEVEAVQKQRDELAWAIAWFLKGGSKDKLQQRFDEYEQGLGDD